MVSDFNKDIEIAPPPATLPARHARGARGPRRPTLSPAAQRFKTCRWQQPSEAGSAEFCTHREVKPYAGTTSFDPEAWCGDCQYYKLRRVPKKRERNGRLGILAGGASGSGVLRLPAPPLVRELLRQMHPLAVGCQLLVGAPVRAGVL